MIHYCAVLPLALLFYNNSCYNESRIGYTVIAPLSYFYCLLLSFYFSLDIYLFSDFCFYLWAMSYPFAEHFGQHQLFLNAV